MADRRTGGSISGDDAEDREAGGLGPPTGAGWELLEKLAVVILAAETVRIIGSVIAGIIAGTNSTGLHLNGQALVGTALQTGAGFADGPGVVLLLLSLGLVWWRTVHWSERLDRSLADQDADGGEPAEAIQLRRLDRLAAAAAVLLMVAAIGAVVFLVGVFLLNTLNGEPASASAQAFANATFPLAYAVIAAGGSIAARHLTLQCRGALARI
jgi:hypothetical protein